MKTHKNAVKFMTHSCCIAIIAIASNSHGWSAQNESMDVPMHEFRANSGSEMFAICRALNKPCGYERLRSHALAKPSVPRLHLKLKTPKEIVNEIVRRHPGYRVRSLDGIIAIEPTKRVGPDLLARKIDRIAIRSRTSERAALMVLAQAKIRVEQVAFGNSKYARIDLELQDVTAREALDAIAKADGQVMWNFTPDEPENNLAFFSLSSWRKTGVDSSEDR